MNDESTANKGPRPRDRLRMADLAVLAGVSAITVSRALRDSSLVRPDVRERIKQLAETHGYKFSSAARNLRLMRTHSIAVVIDIDPSDERPMGDPVILAALGGMMQEITKARYRIVLTTSEQIRSAAHPDADGIILLGQGAHEDAVLQLARFDVPIVVWGSAEGHVGPGVVVGSDNEAGGVLIGRRFAETGRRGILYLGDESHPEVAARVRGVRQGLPPGAKLTVVPCAFSASAGREALASRLGGERTFDAVAACSDLVAIGALDALKAGGFAVPGDVAVIGFDDSPIAATAAIPLTTVRQDWNAAGRLLARKMLTWLGGEEPTPEVIPVSLVARLSA